jgi:hypothetical protein
MTNLRWQRKVFDQQPGLKSKEVIHDALRDQVRDKFRNIAHALKGLVKGFWQRPRKS